MQASLAALARMVQGRFHGPAELPITGAATLRDAQSGDITFIDQPEKTAQLHSSQAAAVIVPSGTPVCPLPAIEVADVHAAFATLVRFFRPPRARRRCGVHPGAWVSPRARLASDVEVYSGAWIDDDVEIGPGTTIHSGVRILAGSRVGADCTLFPNCVLYEETRVGNRCLLHAGAVLGAYGFGYTLRDGKHQLSAQLGFVVLEDDVEIGANTTIDRGTYGPTVIGAGTKIDNQVMIAHNCRIGRHNLICSQVGIAGSSTSGDYVVMAGQCGIRDHVHIGERAVLGAMSGVTNDVAAGASMLGIPATPEREQKLKQAALSKLPEMRRQLKQLQKTVEELQARLAAAESRRAA
jgi:UDP-3-O-[3-hydroxymyristoyl] glucosamine N-acyltransferase